MFSVRTIRKFKMNKNRLEAFSDGVLAIIITVMILEIKIPHGNQVTDLIPVLPVFLSYILSFLYIAIYWNNHHHMMHTVKHVNGSILWANMHLLFWLSLIPFVTGWIGQSNFTKVPMIFYGIILFMAAISYYILQGRIVKADGPESILSKAIGKDIKGKSSIVLYAIAIGLCWICQWISGGIYIIVALIWLIPDKRIEKIVQS